jgi:hypothetical protein
VTGGTCGILVQSLKKHRPFTPTFIGRAEDQAYLLSVLFDNAEGHLRYVHESGLIMRHDKKTLAEAAVRRAHVGKLLGDYIRILLFSHYAKALPWPIREVKRAIDPFTGCFVSSIPYTVVFLRLAVRAASMFHEKKDQAACDLLQMGIERIGQVLTKLRKTPNFFRDRYFKEKQAWRLYYDLLDRAAEGIRKEDPFAVSLQEKAKSLVERCRLFSKP